MTGREFQLDFPNQLIFVTPNRQIVKSFPINNSIKNYKSIRRRVVPFEPM